MQLEPIESIERQRVYHHRPNRKEYFRPINTMILADKAIIRYFSNIQSRRRNNGFISKSTKWHTLYSVRQFAKFLNQPISSHFVSDLIENYITADERTKNQFLDTIQDFSNHEPLRIHRQLATNIKGIFRANRTRLEVFVDNHFPKKSSHKRGNTRANIQSIT